MMAIDVNDPQPPHCTWANHNDKTVGYCDPAFTSVQLLRTKSRPAHDPAHAAP